MNKPPLGLRPQYVYIQERINEILSAMERYTKANMCIPLKWIEELTELVNKL